NKTKNSTTPLKLRSVHDIVLIALEFVFAPKIIYYSKKQTSLHLFLQTILFSKKVHPALAGKLKRHSTKGKTLGKYIPSKL
ncbi:TPA: hypothetical protein DCZ79_01835, partial [Candidatus Nomurabacteria bacterium]|nr:hypothetical protein [Candidatus Nomurabacteria bacterium]